MPQYPCDARSHDCSANSSPFTARRDYFLACNDTRPSCEQIIDMMPEPFVVIDQEYQILAANRAYQKRYGVTSEQVVGRKCHEVSHHSSSPCSEHGEHCPLETVFSTSQPTQVMHIHYTRDGDEEFVQLQATPIYGPNGKIMFMGEAIRPVNATTDDDQILVGKSRPLLRLTSLLQRVAPTATIVLLLGESGSGKEKVAEYIHQYSERVNAPFVVVDCGTLGESLIESELFGHEKGAFTGAVNRKKGLFEAANGGTLFIDEIGELPLSLQTKLLRVLESGMIRRLGGTEYQKVNVRVIAATNRDMKAMVADGQFRQDLYYRLSAFPVTVPSLRARKDDIAMLAEHFLKSISEGDRHLPLSPEVIEALMAYDYPGNIRELRNVIERASILAFNDVLRPEHVVFDESGARENDLPNVNDVAADNALIVRNGRLDEQAVLKTLKICSGHRREAARMLGVSERTLYRYISKMRIDATNA